MMYIKYTIIVILGNYLNQKKAIRDNISYNKTTKNMSNIVDIGVFHLA